MEYLVNTHLNILKVGNGPANVISNRKGDTDLALRTDKMGDLVTNRYAYHGISLSDHTYIILQVVDLVVTRHTYRNPRRNNWKPFQEDLKVNLRVVPSYTLAAGYTWCGYKITGLMLENLLFKKLHNRNVVTLNVLPSAIPTPLHANFPLLEAMLQVIF